MAVNRPIVYIKGDRNAEIDHTDITVGDLLAVECADPHLKNRIKTEKVLKLPQKGCHRVVVSVLEIIALLHQSFPELDIQNLGETDLIVTYEGGKKPSAWFQCGKVILVVLISFFGAAFSMMSFNNDVNVTTLFGQLYQWATGEESTGFTILELTYSIGVSVGILVFFNHFGKKRFSVDPTPIEVEMRLYENDIQTTLVENYSRKGKELDVD